MPEITKENVGEFLKGYADFLRDFELPESDFPLTWHGER